VPHNPSEEDGTQGFEDTLPPIGNRAAHREVASRTQALEGPTPPLFLGAASHPPTPIGLWAAPTSHTGAYIIVLYCEHLQCVYIPMRVR
jgi:hypothetical protein